MRKSALGLLVVGSSGDARGQRVLLEQEVHHGTTAPAGGHPTPRPSQPALGRSGGALDGKGAKVGIILPDTQSSQRWVTADPDALKAECRRST